MLEWIFPSKSRARRHRARGSKSPLLGTPMSWKFLLGTPASAKHVRMQGCACTSRTTSGGMARTSWTQRVWLGWNSVWKGSLPKQGRRRRGFEHLRAKGMVRHLRVPSTLFGKVGRWARVAKPLIVHFAPPCSTFSRARDRSAKTKVRSRTRPGGIHPIPQFVKDANEIAEATYELALGIAHKWGVWVSIENPARSYMWSFFGNDHEFDTSCKDIVLAACRFGAPFQKPTRLRCWNWAPRSLEKPCVLRNGAFSCGRSKEQGHEVLEFGGRSTATAAGYWPGLAEAWAEDLKQQAIAKDTSEGAWDAIELVGEGKVKRHSSRGEQEQSKKDHKDEEDRASTAGMRDPAKVVSGWPELRHVMRKVEAALRRTRTKRGPELQSLTECFGKDPSRAPPSEEEINKLVGVVAQALDMKQEQVLDTHAASTWRFNLVRRIVELTGDPDKEIAEWLEQGAPMGLALKIKPGGHFPSQDPDAEISLDELAALDKCNRNHPSFDELHGEDVSPAVTLVTEHLDSGFARLFKDQADAEDWVGQKVFPAPMGNVTKVKDDKVKHRLIQDLRKNNVNRAVSLPERQVLPRPIDHAVDLATLTQTKRKGDEVACMVLDFANAFMQVPLAKEEMRFNCAHVPQGLVRNREPLVPEEPKEGTFVVWQVLGFGGRPNPLVYSRVASFAMRTAQALFPENCNTRAKGKGQLYVDDPIVVFTGSKEEVEASMDVWLLWMLVLGVPLAWKKGSVKWGQEAHDWIGVTFTPKKPGEVHMELPQAYLDELLEILDPFCKSEGHASVRDAEKLVGKAGRVAHIIPTARPFVAALWGALAAARQAGRGPRKEAPPGRVACKRFAVGAAWLRALVRGDKALDLPLQRRVLAYRPPRAKLSEYVVQFDASPWGGGAVLKWSGVAKEFFQVKWCAKDFKKMDVSVGKSRSQSFFEFLTLFLSLLLWAAKGEAGTIAVIGDNTAALTNALSMKGRGPMLAISREIAWRRARAGWNFEVGHVPAEENEVADALSRLHAVPAKIFPEQALQDAVEVQAPVVRSLWRASPDSMKSERQKR